MPVDVLVVRRRRHERTRGRELLVGVRHDETPGVELPGHRTQVGVIVGVLAETGHVEAEHVRRRLAVDDPVGERRTDRPCLRESGHAAVRHPLAGPAGERTDERVAVRCHRQRTVDPSADPDVGEARIAGERHAELGRDPVDLRRDELHPEVPGRSVDVPVPGVGLVHAEDQPVVFLLEVAEALEIHHCRHHAVARCEQVDVLGEEVVVLHRHQREVDAHHATHAAGPQPSRVDDVLALDLTLVGLHEPVARRGAAHPGDPGVQHRRRAPPACRGDERMGDPVRIGAALVRVVQTPDDVGDVDQWTQVVDLVGREQRGLDAEGVVDRSSSSEPLPSLRCPCDRDPPGDLQTDRHTALGLDLPVELDRRPLQRRDPRVVVHRVEPCGSVPGRPCGQDVPLHEHGVGQTTAGEVVQHAGADDPSADHGHSISTCHRAPLVDEHFEQQPLLNCAMCNTLC